MDRTRISVILPSFNSDSTLTRAIKSTLRALKRQDELLVLVDGTISHDVLEIKKRDRRLKIFARAESTGLVSALNFLLEKSTGDYIARMDSDDVCLRGRFRRQTRFMKLNQLDFVFSNSILFGKRIKPFGFIPQLPLGLNASASNLMLCLSNPFVHSTMLASKKVLDSLGGYKNAQAEDYDLWLRAATEGYRIGRTPGFGVMYRIHDQQISRSYGRNSRIESDPTVSMSLARLASVLRSRGLLGGGENFQEQARKALVESSFVLRLALSPPAQKVMKLGASLIWR
jgi:glycosyltransferase involved in cell wall biosynthesis